MNRSTHILKLRAFGCCSIHRALRLLVLFASLWLAAPGQLQFVRKSQAAEAEAAPDQQPPIAYRRIFVPADKFDAWPREGEKFLPIEARDFEAWVALANQASTDSSDLATIDSAEYSAILDDDGRLHGRGQWSISVRNSKPAFLPLGRPSLVLRELHWQSATEQPVRLGAWGDSGQEPSRYRLQVPRAGTLEFEWAIPVPVRRNPIEIPWRVPAAASTKLTLDLPDGMEPVIDGAAVLESAALPTGADDGKPHRRWVLAIGSATNTVLRITTSSQAVVKASDRAALHETVAYQINQRGVELIATWNLEGSARNERELTVSVPRGVQIISVAVGSRELDWQIDRSTASESDRAIIALPASSNRDSAHITVTAWHPLVVGRPWQLPILRPDGAFWSSGCIDLSVAPELELQSLHPLESAQVGTEHVGASSTKSETYSLVEYSPTATVEVELARRQPDANLQIGSSLVLADQDITGRLMTEWTVARSSLHRLSGELAAGWNVETVETIPTNALAEWFIDRRGNHRQLEIQLTDAAGPARNITVVIMGRLQRFSLDAPIPAETLRIVNWSAAHVARHLLTFQSSEPLTVESVGQMPVLDRDSVTDSDRALLDVGAGDNRIIDLAQAGNGAGLQLSFKRGTYSADVELDATYTGSELRQLHRVTVRPHGNAIDRLLVYSTAHLPTNTRWIDKSTDLPLVAARLPSSDPQYKDLPPEGELWQLQLAQPTSETIDVLASATVAWPGRENVPLVTLPEATEQLGRVIVRSSVDTTPSVEPSGLIPTSRPPNERSAERTDEASLIRAAYRFNPAECLRAPRAPRLWIGPGGKNETHKLVARYLDLESFCWPDGRAVHRATYQLENYGASEFKPTFPPDARLTSISVNGQSLGLPHVEGDGRPATIRLSPHSGSATVAVYFKTSQPPLAAGFAIRPPVIQNGVPLLAGNWTIWLPEEFSVSAASQSGDSGLDWRQRLFGPLARSSDAAPFHPLQLADWARLINGIAGWSSNPPRDSAQLTPTSPTSADSSTPALATASPPKSVDANASASASPPSNAVEQPTSNNTLPGWRAFHQTFIADGVPAAAIVLHPPATTAWAVSVLLAAFLLGRWLCRARGLTVVVLAAIAAGLALLLPPTIAPLATGGLWGFICSLLAEWPRQLLTLDRVENGRRQASIAGILIVAVACGLSRQAIANPPDPQPTAPAAPATTKIERVLIPVDAARRPSGTKYYVSERFLRELLAASSKQSSTNLQWLLLDATYVGELVENHEQADIVAGTWSLTFTLETFTRGTSIALPLVRDEAAWQPTAMLDGVPLPLHWSDTSRSCAVEIPQPGRYSLTVFCVPKTKNENGRSRFTLTVPPLVSASFQLRAPTALTEISVSGASLAPATDASPGLVKGEIGPSDHFAVEWPRLEPKNGAAQGATVAALSWLHVGEEKTELETKYLVEGDARRPDALTIAYDQRWKLITNLQTPDETNRTDASTGRRLLHVPLPSASGERPEVVLRWRLAGARTVGAFHLPPIELTSTPPTQHWFALSADPSLDCTVEDKSATSASAKEFLAKWGGSPESTPQLVIANADPLRIGTLAVRPHEADTTAREVLHVAIGAKAMRLAYLANVTPGAQNRYQFHLTAPADVNVEEIAVTAGEKRIPIRWVRDATDHINIFFSEPAASDYRVSLTGTVPLVDGEPTRLPRVASAGSASAAQQLQLYRDDDVQVSLKGLPPAEESNAGPTDLPPVQWLVRSLGIFHLDEAAYITAHVTVARNEPKLAGDSLIMLSRDTGTWWATFRCRLTAELGDLDVLRIRVPTTWSGPFEIESSVPVTTDLTPVDGTRQLLAIRVAKTILKGDHFDVRLRGPLTTPAGSPPSLPDIAIDSPSQGHRYAIVPTSLDSQSIEWTETGVRPADVPKALLPASIDSGKQRKLEIVSEPFRVAIDARPSKQAAPRIRLADTSISFGERGGQLVAARFVLSSDGLSECTLQLPADDQLVSVKLDGEPALYSAIDATHWRVTLGAADSPQLLEVVSSASNSDASSPPGELRRPTLLSGTQQIPVEVSLWTLTAPRQIADLQVADAAKVSPIDQAALRIDRLASIAEASTPAAMEASPPDGDNWLRAWVALLRDVRDETLRLRTRSASGPAAAQVARASEEQMDRALKRIEQWLQQAGGQVNDSATNQPSTPRPIAASPLASPSHSDSEVACYVAEGGADRLAIQNLWTSATPLQTQILALLVIAGLACAAAWLTRSPVAADCLCRWPHVVGVVLGVIWWAWLSPSWLGLVIVAASVWLAFRFTWPGRSFRAEASTVLRSTRTQ